MNAQVSDPVNNPEHYRFGQMEAWDIIELAVEGIADPVTAYHTASALKYLLRAARKNGVQDIAKAEAHLKREVTRHAVRLPPSPDYDPASVAFRHGELDSVCRIGDVQHKGEVRHKTAAELADADGCIEYGNPVTPWKLP